MNAQTIAFNVRLHCNILHTYMAKFVNKTMKNGQNQTIQRTNCLNKIQKMQSFPQKINKDATFIHRCCVRGNAASSPSLTFILLSLKNKIKHLHIINICTPVLIYYKFRCLYQYFTQLLFSSLTRRF